MKVILASNSPRRKEILMGVGIEPTVIVSGADEYSDSNDPAAYAEDIALCKGHAVYEELCARLGKSEADKELIISADTVVVTKDRILGKPKSRADAIEMLSSLSGNEHEVITAIAIHYMGRSVRSHEVTKVLFDTVSKEQIELYCDTTEPYDKAGAYAIQGLSSKFVKKIDGCYFNVVGLPLFKLYKVILGEFGISLY